MTKPKPHSKPEYYEGPEALEKFKRGMETLFRVPKDAVAKKKQARKPALRLGKLSRIND